jgi:hypothetical protein
MPIPELELRRAAADIVTYRAYWLEETPLRIHSRDTADDGTPRWHHEFANWIFRSDVKDRRWAENPDARIRTKRAFRKLREQNAREYEVLYRVCVIGEHPDKTCEWLNERAYRNGKPDRYTITDVWWFLVVTTDKVNSWW